MYEGNTVYATATANIFKESLQKYNIGTANYGFSLATPASLKDGKTHTLSVRVKGTSYVIPSSPRSILCGVTARIGSEITEEIARSGEIGVLSEPEVDYITLSAAPNPTNGHFVASFNLKKNEQGTVSVTNMLGQAVWKGFVAGNGGLIEQAINLTGQASGMYILSLSVNNQVRTTRVFLSR
ncbi:hypothetical protein ASG33_09835 [Dyadobacter sp. Leaf189]|nr:hypothetical protein ASG33_09835 [Dyadobacter sp. Leaf189]